MKQLKSLSLIFVLLFSILSLIGCGGNDKKLEEAYNKTNDFLMENFVLEDLGKTIGSDKDTKYLYSLTNKSDQAFERFPIRVYYGDPSAVYEDAMSNKSHYDGLDDFVNGAGLPDDKGGFGFLTIGKHQTTTIASSHPIDVSKAKLLCSPSKSYGTNGKIQKNGVEGEAQMGSLENFKKTIEATLPANDDVPNFTISYDGPSDLVLKKYLETGMFKYTITNTNNVDGELFVDQLLRPDGKSLQIYENKADKVEKEIKFAFKANQTQTFIADKNFPEGVIYVGASLI